MSALEVEDLDTTLTELAEKGSPRWEKHLALEPARPSSRSLTPVRSVASSSSSASGSVEAVASGLLIDQPAAGVVHLRLDRPDKRNALDAALVRALHAAVDEPAMPWLCLTPPHP